MFYKLKDSARRFIFNAKSRSIWQTKPVKLTANNGVAVLSMMCHRDMQMYLIALKTFTRHVDVEAVFIVNDGSLLDEDIALLKKHIPQITILAMSDYRSAVCPTGGTWERLLSIASLTDKYYVIQLDADTLTLDVLSEVADYAARNISFTIGTWDNQQFETMPERSGLSRPAYDRGDRHVQIVSESFFVQLKDAATMRYVRGCSGFSGFARGASFRAFIEKLSPEIEALIGDKWKEWGSEQVMSNLVVANSPQAAILPHPEYSNCNRNVEKTRFIHFIGDCRFKKQQYAILAKREIAKLR